MWKKVWDFLTGWMRKGKGKKKETSPKTFSLALLPRAFRVFFPEYTVKTVILQHGEQSVTETLPAYTHYAAPAALGTGDGSSAANAFTIADFLALPPSPGDHLGLTDGTYTTTIVPTAGTDGAIGNYIYVTAINDGAVTINGNGAGVIELFNCDYWWFQGFDTYGGDNHGIRIGSPGSPSNYNVFKKICAYANTDLTGNGAVWSITEAQDTLIEDCAGWGPGRRIINSSQDQDGTTVRRFWGMWNRFDDSTKLSLGIQIGYQGYNDTCENVFFTWDSHPSSANNTSLSERGMFATARIDRVGASQDANTGFWGCCGYLLEPENDSDLLQQFADADDEAYNLYFKDCVFYSEDTSMRRFAALRNDASGNPSYYENISELGTVRESNSVGANWVLSNNETSTTTAGASSVWSAPGTGGRLRYRYKDRTLTSTPLFPWPMDSRIRAALSADGRDPDAIFRGTGNGLTELMESIFGTNPDT